jgi:plasmid stability protein
MTAEFVLSFCIQRSYSPCVKTVCLTIRDCPSEIHRALSERAAAHRRSLNSEIIVVLESALEVSRMSEAELRRAIRSVPSKVRLSLAETRAAIHERRK